MYFKRISLKNVGPLIDVDYEFPFTTEGAPVPVVIVGTNGAGKSIFLSQLLNPLMTMQQLAVDNPEVDEGRTFRLRSSQYITTGQTCHFARIEFGDGFSCYEWQLAMPRTEYEKQFGCPIIDPTFSQIPADQSSVFNPEFANRREDAIRQFNSNCLLYFPPDRFEEPAWLNEHNLNASAGFSEKSAIQRTTQRRIIQDSPLSTNKDWLLDVAFDRVTYEPKIHQIPIEFDNKLSGKSTVPTSVFFGFAGNATNLWDCVSQIVKLVLRSEHPVRFGIGPRQVRNVTVMENESQVVNNIFQLSTGQTSVLNFGLSILRDFDLTGVRFNSIDEISGVVIIDEIDAHLHADLQCNVLPELMKLFPKVQFIVTTHAPLFLLGIKKAFGETGCHILSLPDGSPIQYEDFSEFQTAFEHYSEAQVFRTRIEAEISKSKLPAVFVEGDYDIRYLRKAAELLGRQDVLDQVQLFDGEGFGNLDKIWKNYDSRLTVALPRSVLLLYDCDTNKENKNRGMVSKRVVPSTDASPIEKGIENLFPANTISPLRVSHGQFFDVTPEVARMIRGQPEITPESCSINKNEKRNMCDYLCEHGTFDDFQLFEIVFDLIADHLSQLE